MEHVVVTEGFDGECRTGSYFPWFALVFEFEASVVLDAVGIRLIRHSGGLVSMCAEPLRQELHLATDFVRREQDSQRS